MRISFKFNSNVCLQHSNWHITYKAWCEENVCRLVFFNQSNSKSSLPVVAYSKTTNTTLNKSQKRPLHLLCWLVLKHFKVPKNNFFINERLKLWQRAEGNAKCLSKTELFTSNHLNQLTFQTEDVRCVWCGRFFFLHVEPQSGNGQQMAKYFHAWVYNISAYRTTLPPCVGCW